MTYNPKQGVILPLVQSVPIATIVQTAGNAANFAVANVPAQWFNIGKRLDMRLSGWFTTAGAGGTYALELILKQGGNVREVLLTSSFTVGATANSYFDLEAGIALETTNMRGFRRRTLRGITTEDAMYAGGLPFSPLVAATATQVCLQVSNTSAPGPNTIEARIDYARIEVSDG